jgi:flagellar biosynthesis anti-sigma factor FlgM
MRVGSGHIQQIIGTYLKQTKKPDGASEAPGVPTDQIDLSDHATEVLKARQAYDRLPEIRESRLAEIAGQIKNGTYQLDSSKIADAMIYQSQEDGSAGKDEE